MLFYLGSEDFDLDGEIQINDPVEAVAKQNLESPEDGLSELSRLYTDEDDLNCESAGINRNIETPLLTAIIFSGHPVLFAPSWEE